MTFAIIFNDVGIGEWFVLLAVILVVVGPKRLPEAARKFGNVYAKFRRAADSFKRQLMDMDTAFDRAVAEAERQTDEAFSVPEENPGTETPSETVNEATGEPMGESSAEPSVEPIGESPMEPSAEPAGETAPVNEPSGEAKDKDGTSQES